MNAQEFIGKLAAHGHTARDLGAGVAVMRAGGTDGFNPDHRLAFHTYWGIKMMGLDRERFEALLHRLDLDKVEHDLVEIFTPQKSSVIADWL
jgi:hypothetical protein